jgi:hypothetical protein
MFVVKTPTGYLGKRRYSYKEGTTVANESTRREFARVYTRRGDAENAVPRWKGKMVEGWEIVPVKLVETE